METKDFWKLLLIDDDEDDYIMGKVLVTNTLGDKARLDWSNSFDKGIHQACADAYDVVFINYLLGPQNGLDLLKEIHQRCPGPVLIMVTSWPFDQKFVDEAMLHGAAAVLKKESATPEILWGIIQEALNQ